MLFAAVVVATWFASRPPRVTSATSATPGVAAHLSAATPILAPSKVSAISSERAANLPSALCRSQVLEVQDDASARYCVSEPWTEQNGGLRRYVIDFDDSSGALQIDASGQTIQAMALRDPTAREFRCTGSECAGVTIGERDEQGRRALVLAGAALREVEASDAPKTVRVSGHFTSVPEEELGDAACWRDELIITRENGSRTSFCPRQGAGFEIADNGERTYRFTSFDGESILVRADAGDRLRQVQYLGPVAEGCIAAACGVLTISPPGESGERQFSFQGVAVMEENGGNRTALLNGVLILPPT